MVWRRYQAQRHLQLPLLCKQRWDKQKSYLQIIGNGSRPCHGLEQGRCYQYRQLPDALHDAQPHERQPVNDINKLCISHTTDIKSNNNEQIKVFIPSICGSSIACHSVRKPPSGGLSPDSSVGEWATH